MNATNEWCKQVERTMGGSLLFPYFLTQSALVGDATIQELQRMKTLAFFEGKIMKSMLWILVKNSMDFRNLEVKES